MLHACVQKFDATNNLENFWELNLGRVWLRNSKFKKKIRHLHGDLNLDEIKNAL